MKKILVILAALAMTACASRPFDSAEYSLAISTSILATRSVHQCHDKTPTYYEYVKELNTQTMYLFEYEKFHDANTEVMKGVTVIRQLTMEFMQNHETASDAYCAHKLSEIQSSARTLAKSLSTRTSIELCSSDAMDRLALYDESLKSGKLSRPEYVELVRDLPKLVKSDNAYCTGEQKEAIAKTVSALSTVIGAFK